MREGRRENGGILAFVLPSCVDHIASCLSHCLVILLSCLRKYLDIYSAFLVHARFPVRLIIQFLMTDRFSRVGIIHPFAVGTKIQAAPFLGLGLLKH